MKEYLNKLTTFIAENEDRIVISSMLFTIVILVLSLFSFVTMTKFAVFALLVASIVELYIFFVLKRK